METSVISVSSSQATLEYADAQIQTSHHLLDKLINDLMLAEMSTESSSRLTKDFVLRYKNDPEYSKYFKIDEINNWVENLETNSSINVSYDS